VWSQPLGEAIIGPLSGTRLPLLPSSLTTWETWRTHHPDTLALDVPGWRTGFDLEDMAIVVDRGTEVAAYLYADAQRAGVVNDVVAGAPVAIVVPGGNSGEWAVFSRRLDDGIVELELTGSGLRDTAGGTVFDAFLGIGLSGPDRDQSLDRLSAFTSFPEDFFTFFPTGRLWPPAG